jgi:hypothetical protein
MKKIPCFELIGGKPVAEVVQERFPFDGVPIVSGDYSAATDGVNMEATKVVFNNITKHLALTDVIHERLFTSLCGANMQYGQTLDSYKKKLPERLLKSIPLPPDTVQTNGQLMGNILSFPILCIINLAGWVSAHLSHGPGPAFWSPDVDWPRRRLYYSLFHGVNRGHFSPTELASFNVLINGDDILFKASTDLYARWREAIVPYGFTLSMGKNYISSSFFTVNSELYSAYTGSASTRVVNAPNRALRPWWGAFYPDFFRMRQEIKWETGMDVLSSDLRQVLHHVQSDLRKSVDKIHWPLTNRLWFDVIRHSTMLNPYKGLNWFLPIEQGGMGFDSTGLDTGSVTYAQRKLAVKLAVDPDTCPRGFGADGSLLSAVNEKVILDSLSTFKTNTPVVNISPGLDVVLSESHLWNEESAYPADRPSTMAETFYRHFPNSAGSPEPLVAVHQTVSSFLQKTTIIDRWLDYHTDGVRMEESEVKSRVSAWLRWGLALSDNTVNLLFPTLRTFSRTSVLRAPTYIPYRVYMRCLEKALATMTP